MAIHNRTQIFVDRKVQGDLIKRTVVYWLFCLLALSLMIFWRRVLTVPAQPAAAHFQAMWQFYGPALIASLVLLPIVVIDVIRISNRFAGPIQRLRREMNRLANGEAARPIVFRDNDYWSEFADDFNKILALSQPETLSSQATEEDRSTQEDAIGSEPERPPHATRESDEEQFAEPLAS